MTAGPENITTITEEMVMAYADGALSRPLADRVEAALGQDPAMAAQVERHRRTRALAAAAVAPVLDEPVPARLIVAAQASDGQSRFGASRYLVQGGAAGMALAASFADGFVLAPKPPVALLRRQMQATRPVPADSASLSAALSAASRPSPCLAPTPSESGRRPARPRGWGHRRR
jgi:anti-sigma factor RsiW